MFSNGFYDPVFIDLVKSLMKDMEEFNMFLSLVDVDIRTFIKTVISLSPNVFTSNLVKFIQKNYLNIEPVGKRLQKRRR